MCVGLTELLDCASRGIGSDAKESIDHALGHGLALVGLRGQFAEESLDLGKVALVPVATTYTFQTLELKQARLQTSRDVNDGYATTRDTRVICHVA